MGFNVCKIRKAKKSQLQFSSTVGEKHIGNEERFEMFQSKLEHFHYSYGAFEFYIGTKPFIIGTNLLMVWNVSNYN